MIKLEDQLKIKNKDLIQNLENFNKNKNIKVNLFNPGKHSLKNKSKSMFISSNNIKNYNEGDFIKDTELFEVLGGMPARMIIYQNFLSFQAKKSYLSNLILSKLQIILDKMIYLIQEMP